MMNKALIIFLASAAAALAVTALSAAAQTAPKADSPAAAGKITLKVVRLTARKPPPRTAKAPMPWTAIRYYLAYSVAGRQSGLPARNRH